MLPTLSAYSRYSWYGTDPGSFDRGRDDMRERGYNVGLSARLPLSEDFRSVRTVKRVELEVSRLRAERAKKIAELRSNYRRVELSRQYLLRDVKTRRRVLTKLEHEDELVSRLLAERTAERVTLLQGRVARMMEAVELERGMVERLAAVWKLLVGGNT